MLARVAAHTNGPNSMVPLSMTQIQLLQGIRIQSTEPDLPLLIFSEIRKFGRVIVLCCAIQFVPIVYRILLRTILAANKACLHTM